MLLNDIKVGLSKVNTEILKAAGVDANSAFAHRQFGDLMMAFHQHAKNTYTDAEVRSVLHQHAQKTFTDAEVRAVLHQHAQKTYTDAEVRVGLHKYAQKTYTTAEVRVGLASGTSLPTSACLELVLAHNSLLCRWFAC